MASKSVQPDPPGKKQVLCVYTKLQSYKTAQDKVEELLDEVIDHNDVVVVSHDGTEQYRDALAVTAIVVIDVKQTRPLIMPSRRDRSVDHWDELKKLTTGITDPPGSVLIFLYGDEQSKGMDESLLVSGKWMDAWKFNDERAYSTAQMKRVFSFEETLTEKQRKTLKEYLDIVPLFPRRRASTNVLLLGTQEVRKEYCQYLDEHPFIHQTAFNSETFKSEYRYFNYNHEKTLASGPSINVHFGDTEMPTKLCHFPNVRDALSEQVVEGLLNSRGKGYKSSGRLFAKFCGCFLDCCPSSRWHAGNIDIDRVLVSYHCKACFQKAVYQQEEISTFFKSELGEVGFDVRGEVLPFLTNGTSTDDKFVTDEYSSVLMDLKKKTGEKHFAEKQHRLNRSSPGVVKQMFVYQSAQTPAV